MFFLFIAILFSAISLMLFLFGVESEQRLSNKKSQAMIMQIQTDDAAPALTDMINYHRENAEKAEKAVNYEV